jgi:U3 small nucleolar RNA-associated protein MPP10
VAFIYLRRTRPPTHRILPPTHTHTHTLTLTLTRLRPWELRGEVKATDRPENSLLEAVVDVERARRPEPLEAPAETSQTLEEMIKQRIREERFDDVVPRMAAGEEALLNRRDKRDELPEVSQEKAQEGLGEVYEKEYLRLALGVEGESAEAKEKAEMAALFRKLCTKLDALANFHFTPKAAKLDLSVRPNAPAIAMEEVLPLAVSAADTQAPEEVHEKKKGREGILRDPAELAQEERKRLRQGKKAARRKARRHKAAEEKLVARLNPGLGNKYAREKMRAEIRESGKVVQGQREEGGSGGGGSGSSKFFSALQEEVSQHGGYAKKKESAEGQQKKRPAGSALKL